MKLFQWQSYCTPTVGVFLVWASMSLFMVWLWHNYSTQVLIQDQLGHVIRAEAVGYSWEWMWRDYNEHRTPLLNFVKYLAIQYIGNCQIMGFMSVVFCSLAGLLSILTVWRLRGNLCYTDIVLPIFFLHGGHFWNIQYNDQLYIILATFHTCALIMLMLLSSDRRSGWMEWVALLLLTTLPLHGGNGLLFTPFLGAAMFFQAIYRWRKWNISPWVPVLANVLAVVVCLLYMYDLHFTSSHFSEASFGKRLGVVITGIALSIGQPGAELPYLVTAGLALFYGGAVWKFHEVSKERSLPIPMISLLCLIVAVTLNMIAAGIGRPNHGAAFRYVILATPIAWFLYLLATLMDKNENARVFSGYVQKVLFYAMLLSVWSHYEYAVGLGMDRLKATWELSQDVQSGLPVEAVAARNRDYWFHWSDESFAKALALPKVQAINDIGTVKTLDQMGYETVQYDSPERIRCVNVVRDAQNPWRFSSDGDGPSGIVFPMEEYGPIKAIAIEYHIDAESVGIEEKNLLYATWVPLDSIAESCSQSLKRIHHNHGKPNRSVLWIDARIETLAIAMDSAPFAVEIVGITIYREKP
ncbi:MAG: hypothetical protein Q4C96_05045 [Planctomycetia bacterium]|nr:hypothetical protein [Planctomycetia bacterium]